MIKCPYGGECIDPGNPSDCEVNSACFNFRSVEEKQQFEALPDKFEVKKGNYAIRFKNENQVRFFLRDALDWRGAKIYIFAIDGSKHEINFFEDVSSLTWAK